MVTTNYQSPFGNLFLLVTKDTRFESELKNDRPMKIERPKCGCGNTSDANGYCDGSHLNIENK